MFIAIVATASFTVLGGVVGYTHALSRKNKESLDYLYGQHQMDKLKEARAKGAFKVIDIDKIG